jgi:hypothetical protein
MYSSEFRLVNVHSTLPNCQPTQCIAFTMPPRKPGGCPVLSKPSKQNVKSYSVKYAGSRNQVKVTKLESSQSSSTPTDQLEQLAFVERIVEEQWTEDLGIRASAVQDEGVLGDDVLQLEHMLDDVQETFIPQPTHRKVSTPLC